MKGEVRISKHEIPFDGKELETFCSLYVIPAKAGIHIFL